MSQQITPFVVILDSKYQKKKNSFRFQRKFEKSTYGWDRETGGQTDTEHVLKVFSIDSNHMLRDHFLLLVCTLFERTKLIYPTNLYMMGIKMKGGR